MTVQAKKKYKRGATHTKKSESFANDAFIYYVYCIVCYCGFLAIWFSVSCILYFLAPFVNI